MPKVFRKGFGCAQAVRPFSFGRKRRKMARTLPEAQEEYTKVRTAYLKAVEAESYTIASEGATRTVSRTRSESLKKQMNELAEEIFRLSNGGIRVVGVTPTP